jgi:hypothetical protein
VLNAEKNVKFLSSQTAPGQFTAESATQNIDHHEDIKQTILLRFKRLFLFCLEFCRRHRLLEGFSFKDSRPHNLSDCMHTRD